MDELGSETRDRWDAVAESWIEDAPHTLWREHSDSVNLGLLERWLGAGPLGKVLKTDLFDEAFGQGLYGFLSERATEVVGVELSPRTIDAARARNPGMQATRADVRRLPFGDASFDAIVSNSTLDHLPTRAQILEALAELRRVMRPGGTLVLTLDNLANPIVALRAALPYGLLHRLRLVPYPIGATLGPRAARQAAQAVGLQVEEATAIMHCPRVLAVAACRFLERHAFPERQRRFLDSLLRWERLERWPTWFLTGHFVALRATRPR
jgi:SAM-dependent methyltransferase